MVSVFSQRFLIVGSDSLPSSGDRKMLKVADFSISKTFSLEESVSLKSIC